MGKFADVLQFEIAGVNGRFLDFGIVWGGFCIWTVGDN